MKLLVAALAAFVTTVCTVPAVLAFCGFYVAKADAKLFNRASQVVLVRHENKTAITMANDYQGDPKEFAIVVPVPTVLAKEQIHVADRALVEHLDAYTSPRLVEYFDENPCELRTTMLAPATARGGQEAARSALAAKSLGVTIEARYTVGEYDILILSARESAGLETWLRDNDYRVPAGAGTVLRSYLKQNMRFFVAKVNLAEQAKLGFSYLRPLQMAFESPKFMLPIRLGTLNADGAQELFVYTLTRKGRVESTNYRTVRLPSGVELPVHVKGEFPEFYRAMFAQQVKKEDMRAVFLEYAWDMGWCDPCAANPLSAEELRSLGVFWLADNPTAPRPGRPGPPFWSGPGSADVFVTRLHARYDASHFPDDLVFQETADRTNFQGRYVLRHPWTGDATCPATVPYRDELLKRAEAEATALASLTGWSLQDVRRKMAADYGPPVPAADPQPWWKKIWSK